MPRPRQIPDTETREALRLVCLAHDVCSHGTRQQLKTNLAAAGIDWDKPPKPVKGKLHAGNKAKGKSISTTKGAGKASCKGKSKSTTKGAGKASCKGMAPGKGKAVGKGKGERAGKGGVKAAEGGKRCLLLDDDNDDLEVLPRRRVSGKTSPQIARAKLKLERNVKVEVERPASQTIPVIPTIQQQYMDAYVELRTTLV